MQTNRPLDPLDRVVLAYLCLPLVIFLLGWFEFYAALPLLALTAYALKPLLAKSGGDPGPYPLARGQVLLAVAAAAGWTLFGGTGHWLFANADWHIRDAVLHDLVVSPWPVGYGLEQGRETLLRAPVAYFLPAAVVGKLAGLAAAHTAMALWTAMGASLFMMQVLSLTKPTFKYSMLAITVIVLFSGMDIVGQLLHNGPRFLAEWNITSHLEWWARFYQYSSMTTQLFWVPNHAIGGWLTIGLLVRHERSSAPDSLLPIMVVAGSLWSPLTALGSMPIVIWKAVTSMLRDRSFTLMHPRIWAPALIVGVAVAAFLGMDPAGIPRGWTLNQTGEGQTMGAIRQVQFFLLEAGLLGFCVLWIKRFDDLILALLTLAVLPVVSFGAANDFVMRASIPSLVLLCIATCRVLCDPTPTADAGRKKACLAALLAVGAITPLHEFGRAIVVPSWPINLRATLVAADCGRYPAHYIAHISNDLTSKLLKRPHALNLGDTGPAACANPAERVLEEYRP